MASGFPISSKNQLYYSLAIGCNWGDNLTPLGDNIIVIQTAEKNKRPISFNQFFRLGFITTIYQICLVTIYYTLLFYFLQGLLVVIIVFLSIFLIYILIKFGPKKQSLVIVNSFSKIKNRIIK
jgi:hypothetical protein